MFKYTILTIDLKYGDPFECQIFKFVKRLKYLCAVNL